MRLHILLAYPFLLLAHACRSPSVPNPGATAVIRDIEGPDSLYRPVFHLTPPGGWMNDPNGLVFHAGQWHLFYQHYPDSNVWGPMHWGHATSADLVDWRHQPIALYPDSLGLIFSGSVVVDSHNTSGFGVSRSNPPLVALYTQHDLAGERDPNRDDFQYQSLSYSLDSGRTWTTYAGNPVVPNTDKIRDFRDPKVIWDRAREQWLMVFAAKDRVRFYASPNLREWTFLSEFGADAANHAGVWECPDFFPMVLNHTLETKWVLLQSINPGAANGGSGTFYFTGDWDGERFTVDQEEGYDFRQNTKWLDYGRDNYAGVTFSDVPTTHGHDQRIFIGWMSNWDYAQVVPTTTWRSAMTVPRALTLRQIAGAGVRLGQSPMLGAGGGGGELTFHGGERLRLREVAPSGAYTLRLVASAKTPFEVALTNGLGERLLIGFDPDHAGSGYGSFYVDRRQAGKSSFSEKFATGPDYAPRLIGHPEIGIDILIDRTSVELFADEGTVVITELFWPTEPYELLESSVEGRLTSYKK